ncbi:hypothetical protein J2T13_000878 [Paenibacillus sp. DS2015]
MSEAGFWRCTPKKLFALLEIHQKVNGLGEAETEEPTHSAAYIDQFI